MAAYGLPTVVDNDAIWIGSSQGGAASNSFRGLLDEVAVHRGALSDETLRGRYRRIALLCLRLPCLAKVFINEGGVEIHHNHATVFGDGA